VSNNPEENHGCRIIDNIIAELNKKKRYSYTQKETSYVKKMNFGSPEKKKMLLIMFYSKFVN